MWFTKAADLKKVLCVVGLLAVAVLTITSCSKNTVALSPETARPATAESSSAQPVNAGYLAIEGTGALEFIQWIDSAGVLVGTDQVVSTSGQPPNLTVSTKSLALRGTVEGSRLSLTIEGNAAPLFGTLTSTGFTVDAPQANGILAPVAFTADNADAYNNALAALQQRVASEDQLAAGVQAEQRQEAVINADGSGVLNDVSALQSSESMLNSDLAGMSHDLQGLATDLAATGKLAATVMGEASSGQPSCGDAGSVAGDAGSVAGDAGGIEGDAQGISSDVSELRARIQSLSADFSKLQTAEAALPNYTPTPDPTPAEVSSATLAANQAVTGGVATANGYIDQANADVTSAYGYAAQAGAAGNCGASPLAPAAQPHIS